MCFLLGEHRQRERERERELGPVENSGKCLVPVVSYPGGFRGTFVGKRHGQHVLVDVLQFSGPQKCGAKFQHKPTVQEAKDRRLRHCMLGMFPGWLRVIRDGNQLKEGSSL